MVRCRKKQTKRNMHLVEQSHSPPALVAQTLVVVLINVLFASVTGKLLCPEPALQTQTGHSAVRIKGKAHALRGTAALWLAPVPRTHVSSNRNELRSGRTPLVQEPSTLVFFLNAGVSGDKAHDGAISSNLAFSL
jgi:hypothetical protein